MTSGGLRVIVFKEGDLWIAQCLEIDLCAQSTNLKSVKSKFLQILHAELQSGEDLASTIGPAPRKFFEMWDRRSGFVDRARKRDGINVELAVSP